MNELQKIDAEIAEIQNEIKDVHGTETEVYARIVGYYRAVRNWNKGKAEEFKHRKNFIINDDSAEHGNQAGAAQNECEHEAFHTSEQTEFDVAAEMLDDETETSDEIRGIASYELFVRRTCPNCPPVKDFMADISLKGKNIDVDTDSGLAEAGRKGVFAAPTVIFYDAQNREIKRAHNVQELEETFSTVNA